MLNRQFKNKFFYRFSLFSQCVFRHNNNLLYNIIIKLNIYIFFKGPRCQFKPIIWLKLAQQYVHFKPNFGSKHGFVHFLTWRWVAKITQIGLFLTQHFLECRCLHSRGYIGFLVLSIGYYES